MPNSAHNADTLCPSRLAATTKRTRCSPTSTLLHAIASSTSAKKPKCKGCPETRCKGCHATEQLQPGDQDLPPKRASAPEIWVLSVRQSYRTISQTLPRTIFFYPVFIPP